MNILVLMSLFLLSMQVFESMFRVIKESEYVDERQHCFLIQTFGQNSHYFSVETRQVRGLAHEIRQVRG